MALRDPTRYSQFKWREDQWLMQETQLCREYAKYLARDPILSNDWKEVTCKACHSGRFNGVPDGMEESKPNVCEDISEHTFMKELKEI